jgi:hypothetical protein
MTITPELEAMARAIFESLCEPHKWSETPAAHAHNIEAAKAALLALRDNLSDATVEAGLKANTCALPSGGELVMAVEPAWEAMVDHIVGEPS